ncbi:helix-turn-helix domain-containing protein [Streptomyces heliomycini]|uniref:Helix-turn-helix domain-containing protein n=1 Tax=Streptomyces heliomycini TaxID=284032 RepID=A0ABV5L1W2_9ACTN
MQVQYDAVRFKEARNAQGWSRVRLSKECGVSVRSIESYEQETRIPPAANVERMAKALGLAAEIY